MLVVKLHTHGCFRKVSDNTYMSVKIHHSKIHPMGVQFLNWGVMHPKQGCVSTPLRHPIYTYNGVTKLTHVGILGGITLWVCVKLHTHRCNVKVSCYATDTYYGVTLLTLIMVSPRHP